MRTAAIVFGALGGAAAVVGGLTAGGAISLVAAGLTWMFCRLSQSRRGIVFVLALLISSLYFVHFGK